MRKTTIRFVMYVLLSVRPSVRLSALNNWAPPGRILKKFGFWAFFENLSRKYKLHYNLRRITETLYEDQYIFLLLSRWVFRMRTISNKCCRENQNTYFMFGKFFFSENHAVYGIMWKNMVEPDRPQMTIWHMLNAFWITKATNTYSECVICIAFPLQKWLHEHASMLRYTKIACLF